MTNLETSWDADQFKQLSALSAEREFGRLQVYDSFLKEFENAVKKHIRETIIPKLPPRSYDFMMAMDFRVAIQRPDGSNKTEHNHEDSK